MRKSVALALLAAALAVTGTVGLARPRAAAPVVTREAPAIAAAEARPDGARLMAGRESAALKDLLNDLRHGSTLERARAAREMRKLGPRAAPAIPELVRFLCDGDDQWGRVRGLIEAVLVAIGEEAVPAAIDLIAQPDSRGRMSGIAVLARLRGELAVDTLAPLLAERAVGACAAERLARLGEPGRCVLLLAVADESIPLKHLRGAFEAAGKPMALPLAELLAATDRATRERAASLFAELGKNARPARDAILQALADPAFGDRLLLVETLRFLEGVPAETAFVLADLARSLVATEAGADVKRIRGMGQGYTSRFAQARHRELAPLRALADLGPRAHAALPTLLEIMAAGDPDAGAAAARAYWRIGGDPEVAVDHLVASLLALPKGGYHPGLSVLHEMGSDAVAAIPALLKEMESPSGQRAHPAAAALAAMGERGVTAVKEWLPTGKPAMPVTLAMEFGDTFREDLIARFGDDVAGFYGMMETPVHEILPAAIAGDEGDPVSALRRKLKDPGKHSRDTVFLALRSMGERAAPAIPDLVALLDDEDLRPDAAHTLGSIGPAAASAVPALEPYLDDPWYRGRDAATKALYRITGDTRYRDLAFSPDEVGQDDHWALPLLIEGLGKGGWWCRECVEALGRLGASARPAAPDLARLAANEAEDEHVRDAAREALLNIGG